MPNDVQAAIRNTPKPEALYAKLEDRILARDQKGASEVYYDLVRERRPLTEMLPRRCASTRPTRTCPITSASTTAL